MRAALPNLANVWERLVLGIKAIRRGPPFGGGTQYARGHDREGWTEDGSIGTRT